MSKHWSSVGVTLHSSASAIVPAVFNVVIVMEATLGGRPSVGVTPAFVSSGLPLVSLISPSLLV